MSHIVFTHTYTLLLPLYTRGVVSSDFSLCGLFNKRKKSGYIADLATCKVTFVHQECAVGRLT